MGITQRLVLFLFLLPGMLFWSTRASAVSWKIATEAVGQEPLPYELSASPQSSVHKTFVLRLRPASDAQLDIRATCELLRDDQVIGRFPMRKTVEEGGGDAGESDAIVFVAGCIKEEYVEQSRIVVYHRPEGRKKKKFQFRVPLKLALAKADQEQEEKVPESKGSVR